MKAHSAYKESMGSFWKKQKAKLEKIPLKYLIKKTVSNQFFEIYAVSVDCAGPRPVTPGAESAPVFDPYVDGEAEAASAVPASAAFAITSIDTAGWYSLGGDAMQALVEASRPVGPAGGET